MPSPEPEQPTEVQIRVDLASVLRDKAVHGAYALDKLHTLAARDPHDNPRASTQVADAIADLSKVRTDLIRAAYQLNLIRRPPST